jgi:hypothetical protein
MVGCRGHRLAARIRIYSTLVVVCTIRIRMNLAVVTKVVPRRIFKRGEIRERMRVGVVPGIFYAAVVVILVLVITDWWEFEWKFCCCVLKLVLKLDPTIFELVATDAEIQDWAARAPVLPPHFCLLQSLFLMGVAVGEEMRRKK